MLSVTTGAMLLLQKQIEAVRTPHGEAVTVSKDEALRAPQGAVTARVSKEAASDDDTLRISSCIWRGAWGEGPSVW